MASRAPFCDVVGFCWLKTSTEAAFVELLTSAELLANAAERAINARRRGGRVARFAV